MNFISSRANGSLKSETHHRLTPEKNALLASGRDFIYIRHFMIFIYSIFF